MVGDLRWSLSLSLDEGSALVLELDGNEPVITCCAPLLATVAAELAWLRPDSGLPCSCCALWACCVSCACGCKSPAAPERLSVELEDLRAS